MKIKIKNNNTIQTIIYILSLGLTFTLGELFYNSIDGTDFYRYYNYIEYFQGNIGSPAKEQGLIYFWYISQFIKLSQPYYVPSEWESIYSSAIQLGNFFLYLIGSLGLYYFLRNKGYRTSLILTSLTLLNIFPPIFGARLIMKPEILAFALLPWIIISINKYFISKNFIYIFISAPLISVLLTSKASIAGSIVFTLIYIFYKQLKKVSIKDFIFSIVALLVFTIPLYIENEVINGYTIFNHPQLEQYLNKANLYFLYNINFTDLLNDPFRNSHANSFLGITLIDTFGDYFNRYWDHGRSLFYKGRIDLFDMPLLRRYVSIILSAIFIIFSLKPSNNKIQNFQYLYLIGILILLLSSFGIFGLNFNPAKGDTLKTHYYSYLLAFSFVAVVINWLKNKSSNYNIISIFISLLVFLFIVGFPKNYSNEYNALLSSSMDHSISCRISSIYYDSITDIDSKCITKVSALCGDYQDYLKPINHPDGYLIFQSDPFFDPINLTDGLGNFVTISGYAECIHYQDGGYILTQSASWGDQSPRMNIFIFVISIIGIIYLIIDLIRLKK